MPPYHSLAEDMVIGHTCTMYMYDIIWARLPFHFFFGQHCLLHVFVKADHVFPRNWLLVFHVGRVGLGWSNNSKKIMDNEQCSTHTTIVIDSKKKYTSEKFPLEKFKFTAVVLYSTCTTCTTSTDLCTCCIQLQVIYTLYCYVGVPASSMEWTSIVQVENKSARRCPIRLLLPIMWLCHTSLCTCIGR